MQKRAYYQKCNEHNHVLLQDFNAFARYISQFKDNEFPEFVSDLHVLVFMATLDIMPLRYFVTLWKRRITFSSPGNSWGRCTLPWQVRIEIRWEFKNLKQKCFFSPLMRFLLDYWVEPWGAMAESTSYHPGLDLITSFLKWIQIWWKFSIQLRSRFQPAFPPPCFPQITPPGLVLGVHTIAWTSINNLGALCLG